MEELTILETLQIRRNRLNRQIKKLKEINREPIYTAHHLQFLKDLSDKLEAEEIQKKFAEVELKRKEAEVLAENLFN